MFVVGVLLFDLLSTINSISTTIMPAGANPFFNSQGCAGETAGKFSEGLAVIFKIICGIEVLAAINGLTDWKNLSEGLVINGYSKSTWHLIGGWCVIHLDDVIHILKFLAGIDQTG